jgi:hypothetical protein
MKQSSIFLVVAACLSAFGQQAVPNASVDAYLNRVFNTEEFKLKSFGPAAWLDEGAAYTTVENKEIIRYDTASGQREVLVSAAALTPKGRKDPLMVSGYKWSLAVITGSSIGLRVR